MENSHGRIYRSRRVDEETAIRREGKRVWRGKCASDPKIIAELIRKRVPAAKRVVFETGTLPSGSITRYARKGCQRCIDARHAKAALDMAPNKTDANDADGLADLAEVGFFREVRVKGFDSMLTRTLVAARTRLVRITTELSNQIRGIMKTFGPASFLHVRGTTFEKNVRRLLIDHEELALIVLPMWRPGAAFASVPPSLGASVQMQVRARHAACSCRSRASAPSPQPRSPLPLKIRTTSRRPDLLDLDRPDDALLPVRESIMTAIYPDAATAICEGFSTKRRRLF
nr:transposase [Mesorhizobium sp.]